MLQTWPWSMVSAFAAIAGLFILLYVNFFHPVMRRIKLKNPVNAHFLIPSRIHHDCSFSVQDDEEHLVKTIVVPSNTEVVIDFRFQPRMHFTTDEVGLGCEGDFNTTPYATEYFNRFISVGEGQHIIPGTGNRHYIDKHLYYHNREQRQWSRGTYIAMAFKFMTRTPGQYKLNLSFVGDEIEGNSSDLLIIVEDRPTTPMRCIVGAHRNLPCAKRILPIEKGVEKVPSQSAE